MAKKRALGIMVNILPHKPDFFEFVASPLFDYNEAKELALEIKRRYPDNQVKLVIVTYAEIIGWEEK